MRTWIPQKQVFFRTLSKPLPPIQFFLNAEQPKPEKAGSTVEWRHFGPRTRRHGDHGTGWQDAGPSGNLRTIHASTGWTLSPTQTWASFSPWLTSPHFPSLQLQLSSLQNVYPPKSQGLREELEAGREGAMERRGKYGRALRGSHHPDISISSFGLVSDFVDSPNEISVFHLSFSPDNVAVHLRFEVFQWSAL